MLKRSESDGPIRKQTMYARRKQKRKAQKKAGNFESCEERNLMAADFGFAWGIQGPQPATKPAMVAPETVPSSSNASPTTFGEEFADITIDRSVVTIDATTHDDEIIITDEGDTLLFTAHTSDQGQFRGYSEIRIDKGEVDFIISSLYWGNDTFRNNTDLETYVTAYGGNNRFEGGTSRDVYTGGNGVDVIYGRGGDDDLYGRSGNDRIYGGEGDDEIGGDGDDDRLYGQNGEDVINGGGGHDTIIGGRDADTIDGQAGNDSLFGGTGDDTLDGGSGTDWLYGGADNDLMRGGANNDWLYGGRGDDIVFGNDGDDSLYGQSGDDTLMGGANTDYVSGGDGDDALDGGTGNDYLYGGNDDDQLFGRDGIDFLFGEAGRDLLDGGDDGRVDKIYGGSGQDFFIRHAVRFWWDDPDRFMDVDTDEFDAVFHDYGTPDFGLDFPFHLQHK